MPNVPMMPTIFQIEIPSEFRDKFWDHPEDKLRFWAFKNRPHCFLEEKLLFTFDRRPVAEAKVLKMEDPGKSKCDATGQYEDYWKVFWSPSTFKRYKQKTGASQWMGPVYHGTNKEFEKFNPAESAAGIFYFTDDPDYADSYTQTQGMYDTGANIRPTYIRMNKPFDATAYATKRMNVDEFAKILDTKLDLSRVAKFYWLHSEKMPFWNWVIALAEETKNTLESRGYDGIIQKENLIPAAGDDKTSYVVFNPSQIRNAYEKQGTEIVAKKLKLYHGTRKEFQPGDILTPQPGGYTTYLEVKQHEEIMERNKPVGALSRKDSVFMVDDPDLIDSAGGSKEYIYEVEPIGKVEKNDMEWYSQISDYEWDDMENPEADKCAQGYWSGRQMGGIHTLFEYRAPQARIIRLVSAMKEASVKTANWRQARDIQRGNWIAERDGVFQVTQVLPEGDEIVALGKGGLVRRYDPNDEVNIWKTGALKPSDEFRFIEECRDAYSGQSNMILRAYKIQPNLGENPDDVLGHLRYTVYNGEISSLNCYISKEYIEQGVGAALVKELQRLYPNAEIPLRDIDDQYDLTSLKIKKEPSEYVELFKEMEWLEKENVRLQNVCNEYWETDTHTKEEDQNFKKEIDHWDEISDRLWILEQDLQGLTRTKTRIIGAKDDGFVDTEGNPISEEEIIENPEKGFWGTEASGILPICPSKGTVCLAWRSPETHLGDCWGSVGGAIPEGLSAAQSAKAELKEEIGYKGEITLLPAYVFTQGTFKYYNFVGIVPNEFAFTPTKKHSWETERIEWVPYAEVQRDMQTNPSHYHPGMLKLFENSGDVIEKALGMKIAADELPPTQAELSLDKEASYHPNFTVGDKVYWHSLPTRIGVITRIIKQHSNYTSSNYTINVRWETPGYFLSGKEYGYDDTDLHPVQESFDFKEAGDKKAAKIYECNGYKFSRGMEVSHWLNTSLIGKITNIEKGEDAAATWNGREWETVYWASVNWRDQNSYTTKEKLHSLRPVQMNLFEKESAKYYECNGRKFVRGMDVVLSKYQGYKGKIKKFKKDRWGYEALIEWYAPESMKGDLQWWGLESIDPSQMDIQFKESSTHIYHVTRSKNVENILQNGLLNDQDSNWYDPSGLVYLTEKSGVDYWKHKLQEFLDSGGINDTVTVLEINPKNNNLILDEVGSLDAGSLAYTTNFVPANQIKIFNETKKAIKIAGINQDNAVLLKTGKPFSLAAVNLLDGRIEETHTFKEAEAGDWHHTFVFSPEIVEREKWGDDVLIIWIEDSGEINGWVGVAPSVKEKIQKQIQILPKPKTATTYYHGGADIPEEILDVSKGQTGAIFVTPDKEYAQRYVKNNGGGLYTVTLDDPKIFDPRNSDHLEQLQQGYLNLVGGDDYDDEETALSDYHNFIGQGDLMMDWAVAPDAFDAIKTLGFKGMRMRERPGKITQAPDDNGYEISGKPIESVALFDKTVPAKRIAGQEFVPKGNIEKAIRRKFPIGSRVLLDNGGKNIHEGVVKSYGKYSRRCQDLLILVIWDNGFAFSSSSSSLIPLEPQGELFKASAETFTPISKDEKAIRRKFPIGSRVLLDNGGKNIHEGVVKSYGEYCKLFKELLILVILDRSKEKTRAWRSKSFDEVYWRSSSIIPLESQGELFKASAETFIPISKDEKAIRQKFPIGSRVKLNCLGNHTGVVQSYGKYYKIFNDLDICVVWDELKDKKDWGDYYGMSSNFIPLEPQGELFKSAAHGPNCRCAVCAIPKENHRWLTGECYEFALALSEKMPDASFVSVGKFKHVGLHKGAKFYDVRGEMTPKQFASIFDAGVDSIQNVTRDQVLDEIGWKDWPGEEWKQASEMKAARKAVRQVFGGNKTADFDYDTAEKYLDGEQTAALNILDEYKAHLKEKNYRQKWSLVPAARLKKIWNDYAKTGMVHDIKGMDDIVGVIVTNIHKIRVNTVLCGHDQDDPIEYAKDITNEDYPENYFEILEHFFDDEKGSWRISDYATIPLMKLAYQLTATINPEEQLQLVDKVLNIVHQRSDLSSWFIQGGRQTLNQLFGSGKFGAEKTAIDSIFIPKNSPSTPLYNVWHNIDTKQHVGEFMGFHVEKGRDYSTEIYCIKDNKSTVGLISGSIKNRTLKIEETFIYPKYRGQNIAPNFYAWLLNRNIVRSIISGETQSKGGRKLWENLAQIPGIMVFAWRRGKAISLDSKDLGEEEFIWGEDVYSEIEELEKEESTIIQQMYAVESKDDANYKSNPRWIELNKRLKKIQETLDQLPNTGNIILVAQKATTKKASIKTAAGTWQQAEQVLQNIDPEHELILFHSGTSDIDQSINEVGLIAEMGEWVEEVLYGATDNEELIQNIREKGGAVFFDETPSWIKAKVERKIKRRATTNDIKKYGQLTLVVADLDGPIRRYIGSGKHGEEVETLRKERWVEDDLPFGLEPGDFFSTEDIAATVTLTGDDLVMFMNKHFPGENPLFQKNAAMEPKNSPSTKVKPWKQASDPAWEEILSRFPKVLQEEICNERSGTPQDMAELSGWQLTSPQPITMPLKSLLLNNQADPMLTHLPENVIAIINRKWNIKIVPDVVYDQMPGRYETYSKLIGDTAQPSVFVNGLVYWGCGRFVAALMRGDSTLRIWNVENKGPEKLAAAFDKIVPAKTSAQRQIYYHGTDIKNLRSILTEGLVPEGKTKSWADDPNAGMTSPSRQTYGGIYLTRNMMTATAAVRNNRSNADYRMVMVIVEAQPNSLFLDEDSIVSILDSPFNNGNQDSSEHLIGQYFMMTLPDAPSSLKEAYQEMQGRYIDKVIERIKYMLTEHKLTMAPGLEKRVRELLPSVLLASLTRRAAHAYKSDEKRTEKDGYDARNYDYRRTYQSIFGQVEAPPKETIIPTPQDGEKKFRETAEQLTRTLRSMLRIQQGGGWALQNARSTEPIGYNGSNHIIAVLEIREGRDLQIKFNDLTGYEGKGTMVPIVVHYGAVPEDFNQQWKERMGYRIYWLKPGEIPPPSTYVKPDEPTEKPTEVTQEQPETDPPNAQPTRSYVTASNPLFQNNAAMDAGWKLRVQQINAPALEANPALRKLHGKILEHGGDEAMVGNTKLPSHEIERLLTRGQYWDGTKAKHQPMRAINCHGNSCELMGKGIGQVANGFALSDDGLWRIHSWVVTKTGVIETTTKRVGYFGVVLTNNEVEKEYDDAPKRSIDRTRGVVASMFPDFEQVMDESTDTNGEFDMQGLEDPEAGYQETLNFWQAQKFPLVVYRALSLNEGDEIRYEDAGLSWSLDKDEAISVVADLHSNDDIKVLEGKILTNAVNWVDTFRCWMTPLAEQEVRLKPGAKACIRLLPVV